MCSFRYLHSFKEQLSFEIWILICVHIQDGVDCSYSTSTSSWLFWNFRILLSATFYFISCSQTPGQFRSLSLPPCFVVCSAHGVLFLGCVVYCLGCSSFLILFSTSSKSSLLVCSILSSPAIPQMSLSITSHSPSPLHSPIALATKFLIILLHSLICHSLCKLLTTRVFAKYV